MEKSVISVADPEIPNGGRSEVGGHPSKLAKNSGILCPKSWVLFIVDGKFGANGERGALNLPLYWAVVCDDGVAGVTIYNQLLAKGSEQVVYFTREMQAFLLGPIYGTRPISQNIKLPGCFTSDDCQV